jgi:hypothetical protein
MGIRSYRRAGISHTGKEVRTMAEAITMLAVGGLVAAVSVGVAYLVIYLYRE